MNSLVVCGIAVAVPCSGTQLLQGISKAVMVLQHNCERQSSTAWLAVQARWMYSMSSYID